VFNSLRRCAALALALALIVSCGSEAQHLRPDEFSDRGGRALATPPSTPRPLRERLPNGITVLLIPAVEGQASPPDSTNLVYGMLRLATGKADDPAGQEGLAEVTATVLLAEAGVALGRQPAWNDARLQALGAHLRAEVSNQWTDFYFRCPEPALQEILELLGRVLIEPEIPESLFTLAYRWGLETTVTSGPEGSLQQARLALGGPIGLGYRPASTQSLTALGRVQVQDFQRSHYGSRQAIFALSGNAHSSEFHDSLVRIFGSWPGQAAAPTTPWKDLSAAPAQVLINLNGSEDAPGSVSVLLECPPCDHPDYPALLLATALIRRSTPAFELRGELRHSSRWVLSQQIPANQVSNQLKYFRAQLERGPRQLSRSSALEFEDVREQLIAEIDSRRFSPEERLRRAAELEAHGYPRNFYDSLMRSLARLSQQEVEAAYSRHLRLDRLQVFLEGDRSLLTEDFSDLAKTSIWPRPALAQPRSAAFESTSSSTDWRVQVLRAHGGLDAWQEAALLTCQLQSDDRGLDSSIQVIWEYPDFFRFDARPQGAEVMVLDGDQAWLQGSSRSRLLGQAERYRWAEFARAFLPWVLMDLARDPDQVIASAANFLKLDRSDGIQLQLELDSQARIIQMRTPSLQIRLLEYRWQDGLLLPGKVEIRNRRHDSKTPAPGSSWRLLDWQVNPERQPQWFDPPQDH
jgi:predicted Zn-dependent peptidase